MQDFEKIAAIQDLISEGQTKEAVIGAVLKPLMGAGKWIAKNPLKSLGAGVNTYFIGDAASSGAKAVAKPRRLPMPKNTMATF
jgi:hypothetical protein